MIKDIIVLEGLNGCGKTTLANSKEFHSTLLSTPPYDKYSGVEIFRCPGDGILEVRDLIKNPENNFNNLTYMNLSFADMNELVQKKIIPTMKDNKLIILDRCFHSTLVYQDSIIYTKKIIDSQVKIIFGQNILDRMSTFILDIPYEVSQERQKKLGTIDKFEKGMDSYDFYQKRLLYLNLLTPSEILKSILENVFVLDGTASISKSIERILIYLEILNNPRSSK